MTLRLATRPPFIARRGRIYLSSTWGMMLPLMLHHTKVYQKAENQYHSPLQQQNVHAGIERKQRNIARLKLMENSGYFQEKRILWLESEDCYGLWLEWRG